MGFLDNSGDIILDAVLTDAGRARLAKGDGSFKIVKYAFGDDEIDYAKYDKDNTNGSAYYDIEILRTPVLEAFTNNTSTMKSKLLSIPRTNLLFLPVLMLNQNDSRGLGGGLALNNNAAQASGMFAVPVDQTTRNAFSATTVADNDTRGVLLGGAIQIDQGLNTTAISFQQSLDSTLVETQFIVEIDNRLGSLANSGGVQTSYSYLDDDNIASYNITNAGTNSNTFFKTISGLDENQSPIRGPRGTAFQFTILSSLELQTSTYLFDTIGSTGTSWSGVAGTYSIIDTNIKVTGATTGYSIDIPVRFIKQTSAS
jgi:hypothetical protein